MTAHVLRAALVLAAVSAPVLEHAARGHARAALARCATGRDDCGALGDWDLDIDGLRLAGLERELAGARWSAARVHVGVDRHGIAVDVDDLVRSELAPATTRAAARETATAQTRARPRVDLHGIPARVRIHGRISQPLPEGALASLVDPVVSIDSEGTPRASASAVVALPGPHELVLADAQVEPGADGRWHVRASASLDAGPPVAVTGELGGRSVQLRATTSGDATIEIDADRSASPPVASLRAQAWPLATLGPAVAAGLVARGLDLSDASIDGDVALALGSTPSVRAQGLVVRGVRVDDPRLATRAVRFAAIALDGTVQRTDDGWHAEAALAHRDAHVYAKVDLVGERLHVEARLDELGCDRLLAAMPDGMTDTLAGARVTGSIAGTAAIDVELDRLATVDLDADGPPGKLAVSFPLLEQCRTTADPPGIDLAALSGPYRHVFVAGGRRYDRVLAPGAPGFVPLSQARRIAAAFVALEDMRFRTHDGFDREQIERAFWHNLVAGGVRRGASTISQQTARNLWLGVDRSLARKLQEAWLTARLEASVDKDRILELYVNLIELGPGVFGIDEGARHHFGVPADELDVLQALHLASLAPAPRTLSKRFASGEVDDAWLTELREHARRMHRNGMISEDELMAAMGSDLRLRAHTSGASLGGAAP